jgi:hypothetical protein
VADSAIAITAGAGTNVDTRTESVNGDHRQVVCIGDPVTGGNVAAVTAGGALEVIETKDFGRTAIVLFAVGAASGATATETAITLTKSAGTAATTAAATFVVTSGKTFRITGITVGTRGHATATLQTTTFNLRLNTAGAVTTTSTPVLLSARAATPATTLAWDRVSIPIPDGLEIAGNGTVQFGITAASTFITNAPTWDVLITGYEY